MFTSLIPTVHVRSRFIPDHIVKGIAPFFYIVRRFRCQGRTLHTVHDLVDDLVQVDPFRMADAAFHFGKIRHDVGGRTTVQDIRADAGFGPHVLAQHIHSMRPAAA